MKDSLIKLYNSCERVKIDGNSKIVIMSDVHRGDGSYSDSFIDNRNVYYAALLYYYKEGYTLVEAGDGDELWKNKSFRDIAYNYKGVFKLMKRFNKEKRLHLLYGNHDEKKSSKEFIDKEVSYLNCMGIGEDFVKFVKDVEYKEGIVLNYTPLNKDIFITHGHQVDFMNYELCMISKFLVRYFWRFLEGVAGFKAPTSPANNYKKGGVIDDKLEAWAKKNNKFIICGHTHKSRFPKAKEGSYFNDGCCVLPYSISTIEINLGLISLVKWSIEPKEDNVLYIRRTFLGGPEKLDEYLK